VATAREISTKLTRHGRDPQTPVLVIENGTRPDEVRIRATLDTLEQTLAARVSKAPALLIIGEVVSLYQADVAAFLETVA